jgi:two-component system OmpR family response regulator
MRILLIEDDREMSSTVRDGLRDRYTVDYAFTGKEALLQAENAAYDICILDIGLPDMNGVEVCTKLRLISQETPILMLTASNELQDIVRSLDAGADDFLSKPFHFDELLARLRALTRRGKTLQPSNSIQVGEVSVNLSEGNAYHQGIRLDLRRKEFLLLEYFLRHAGRVVTRNMLLEQVWESKSDPLTNTVDVHIKFLRDKVDKPFGTKHIRTIHGMGYKFTTEKGGELNESITTKSIE